MMMSSFSLPTTTTTRTRTRIWSTRKTTTTRQSAGGRGGGWKRVILAKASSSFGEEDVDGINEDSSSSSSSSVLHHRFLTLLCFRLLLRKNGCSRERHFSSQRGTFFLRGRFRRIESVCHISPVYIRERERKVSVRSKVKTKMPCSRSCFLALVRAKERE